MELIIEEISRGKKVIGRHKFASKHIAIGRGYSNDIILSDPHVCAQHLSINCEDGIWYIDDLESLNGTMQANKAPVKSKQVINSGDIVHVGKSQLRFYYSDHPVVESIKFSELESLVEKFGRWSSIIAMISIFALLNFAMLYLNNSSKEVTYSQLFIGVFSVTLSYALWPLLCSLIGFLNKYEPRVGSQIGVSFVVINIFWIVDFFETFITFNTSSQFSVSWLFTIIAIALTFILFWLNFYIAFQQSAKRRLRVSIGLTALIYGGLFISDLSDRPEFNPYPIYDSTIMTPVFSLTSASTTSEFIEQSSSLYEETDKLVTKNEQD